MVVQCRAVQCSAVLCGHDVTVNIQNTTTLIIKKTKTLYNVSLIKILREKELINAAY